MVSDQTHNIHTWLEAWRYKPSILEGINTSKTLDDVKHSLAYWAYWASRYSQGAFTSDQCAEVIKTWPEYKEAVKKLGGGSE